MYEKFGWSGMQRAYYGALVCLVDQEPFRKKVDYNKIEFAWMAFKEMDSVINNVARLFGLKSDMVKIVVQAARKCAISLKWLKNALEASQNKEVIQLFEDIITEGKAEHIDSDEEPMDLGSETMSMSGTSRSKTKN